MLNCSAYLPGEGQEEISLVCRKLSPFMKKNLTVQLSKQVNNNFPKGRDATGNFKELLAFPGKCLSTNDSTSGHVIRQSDLLRPF